MAREVNIENSDESNFNVYEFFKSDSAFFFYIWRGNYFECVYYF